VGELLFFGCSPTTIHHVAMYVGKGEMIQSPTTGVPVQVVPVVHGPQDYLGAKRLIG
jgi:cell wall-associated NlpC family hydrolase